MEAKSKTCIKCGRALPLEAFGNSNRSSDGKRPLCKECYNKRQREYVRKHKLGVPVLNPALSEFTPQELMTELAARNYEGELTYKEVKVHRIKIG